MLHADELRRAIEAASRTGLPKVSALLWLAYSKGQVSEAEAEALAELIAARQGAPEDRRDAPRESDPVPVAAAPIVRRYGSRPRTPASMERRRRWAASGRLPPVLAVRFTLAEQAVLAVIAVEVGKAGVCGLHLDHLAALAGVSRTTVKNAIREARALGLVSVELRERPGWRNDSNLIRIVSAEWQAWMRLARRETRIPVEGGGVKTVTGTHTGSPESSGRADRIRKNGSTGGARGDRQGQDSHRMRQDEPWRPSTGRGRQP